MHTAYIYRAAVDTRNFSFEAFARNEAEARICLVNALHAHADQYDLDTSFVDSVIPEVEVQKIKLNSGYRDHTILIREG